MPSFKIIGLLVLKKILKGYRYHKLRKAFSKFYRRHYELISKFNVGLKSLLHQGLSEPEFFGDLVYRFKKIRGMTDFSDQFRKKYNALQTDLGSITLKCNALHYNYFQKPYITLQLQLQGF